MQQRQDQDTGYTPVIEDPGYTEPVCLGYGNTESLYTEAPYSEITE